MQPLKILAFGIRCLLVFYRFFSTSVELLEVTVWVQALAFPAFPQFPLLN